MIDTTKFFFNKNTHVALAESANELADTVNVTVSRWVNNSKGRQIVTYMIHTGERNQFASKQENVLFTVVEDAGRGNKVRDESAMLNQVIDFLNTLEAPESESNDEYVVVTDLIEAYEPVTLAQIESVVSEWDYEGWTLETTPSSEEVRVYAYRSDSEDRTPSRYTDWIMVTPEYGYIVVAEIKS